MSESTDPAEPASRGRIAKANRNANQVEIVVEDGGTVGIAKARKGALRVMETFSKSPVQACVFITSDARLRELNKLFRGIDEPTDVLSFPAPESNGAAKSDLGDIAISIDRAKAQANAHGIELDDELAYLTIHGTLHLFGFEDETGADRKIMAKEMKVAAKRAGLRADFEWHSIGHSLTKRSRK
jgi:probable rRNA maturation factor